MFIYTHTLVFTAINVGMKFKPRIRVSGFGFSLCVTASSLEGRAGVENPTERPVC